MSIFFVRNIIYYMLKKIPHFHLHVYGLVYESLNYNFLTFYRLSYSLLCGFDSIVPYYYPIFFAILLGKSNLFLSITSICSFLFYVVYILYGTTYVLL